MTPTSLSRWSITKIHPQVDLAQAKRRIMLIREDLRHATERLSVQEEKLTVTQTECEEVQNARDEMESHEGEQEGVLENI